MLKLHDSIWIVADSMMQPRYAELFGFKESAKLGVGEQIMYDFFLHLVKSFEVAEYAFDLNLSDLDAYYSLDCIAMYESELVNGIKKFIPFDWKLEKRYYPRMMIPREITTLPVINFEKSVCNCTVPERTLRNGPYGMYIRCNKCRANTKLHKFIE